MTNPVAFLKEVRAELRQVTWPTRNDVVRLTMVVLIISLIVGFYIGALDFAFTTAFEILLR